MLNLVYQAKGQGVTYKSICDAVFSAYGCADTTNRDSSLPPHLKSGHDNVPPDVIDAARAITYEDAVIAFDRGVVGLIAEANAKQFIYAVKAVLREDDIPDDTLIGSVAGFEKSAILERNKFIMAPLMASLFRYAIVDVSNADCADSLKSFEKNYLTLVDSSGQLFIDPLPSEDEAEEEETSPLQRTIDDGTFGRTFKKISSVIVSGLTHRLQQTSTVPIPTTVNCASSGSRSSWRTISEPMFSQDRRWTVSKGDLSEPLVHRRSLSLKRCMAQVPIRCLAN